MQETPAAAADESAKTVVAAPEVAEAPVEAIVEPAAAVADELQDSEAPAAPAPSAPVSEEPAQQGAAAHQAETTVRAANDPRRNPRHIDTVDVQTSRRETPLPEPLDTAQPAAVAYKPKDYPRAANDPRSRAQAATGDVNATQN